MNKLKRGAGRVWGCLASVASLICGLIVGLYFFYKPGETESKSIFDRATEVAFVVITGCAVAIAGWMGGWCDTATALVVVMVADYVTGFAAACFKKSKKTKSGGLSSRVGFFGLMKKVFMLVSIIVAHQVDVLLSHGSNAFRDVVIGCLLANEGLSFYENVALFGVPFPRKLRRVLDQLRDPEDSTSGIKPNDTEGSGSHG